MVRWTELQFCGDSGQCTTFTCGLRKTVSCGAHFMSASAMISERQPVAWAAIPYFTA
jgi:hypothetical protein